jgi:hypothetical protein
VSFLFFLFSIFKRMQAACGGTAYEPKKALNAREKKVMMCKKGEKEKRKNSLLLLLPR